MGLNVLTFSMIISICTSVIAFSQGDLENYPEEIWTKDHAGQTYLSFMKKVVKPSLDTIATEGYKVCSEEDMMQALSLIHI